MRQCSEAENCAQKDCVHIKKHEGNALWGCGKWEGSGEEGCYYNRKAKCLRIKEYSDYKKEYLDSTKEAT